MDNHSARRVTRADVARVAGTSVAVVSYVINNGPRPVAEATRLRVLAAIEQTGYRPNDIARALASGSTQTYGLVVPDISNPFFATLARALLRIEHRHDLIPHLPLPPSLARVVGRSIIDPLLGTMDWLAPMLRGARVGRTEYIHTGELLYDDGASTLYRVPPGDYLRRFGPILRQELASDLFGRGAPPDAATYRDAACPVWATPVPARLMDGVRLSATIAQVVRQVRQQRLDFLLDHHIDGALAFVERIERQRH